MIEKVATWIVGMAKKGGRLVAESGRGFSGPSPRLDSAMPKARPHDLRRGRGLAAALIAAAIEAAENSSTGTLPGSRRLRAEARRAIDDIAIGSGSRRGSWRNRLAEEEGAAWDRQRAAAGRQRDVEQAPVSNLVRQGPLATQDKSQAGRMTGTFEGSMPKPKGDDFTPDHQPQAAVLVKAAKFRFFSPNGELVERAEGRAKEGYAINLYKKRHQLGRTYGMKGKGTKEDFFDDIRPLIKDRPASEQRQEVIRLLKLAVRRDATAIKQVVRAKYDRHMGRRDEAHQPRAEGPGDGRRDPRPASTRARTRSSARTSTR